jgi:hypothetical protein
MIFSYLKPIFRPIWHLFLKKRINKLCYSYENQNKIIKLKNKHKNQKCFIVGNGPSLTIEDLEKLKTEITFSSNSIYYLFENSDWRPTYYFCQDQTVLSNSVKEINQRINGKKFIRPTGYKEHLIDDAIYFNIDNLDYKKNVKPRFSDDVAQHVFEGYTVTYSMLQFAAYMGFNEIYLLGIDFNYIITNGTINKDSYADKRMGEKVGGNPNIEYNLLAYQTAKEFCRINNIKIYNATRGGMLEVFPRVDFRTVI